MATFHYTARMTDGTEAAGEVEAPSLDEARRQLAGRGLAVIDLTEIEIAAVAPPRRLSAAAAEHLARQVAQVSASRLPLAPGLRAAAEECDQPVANRALLWMAAQLEQGQTLETVLTTADAWLPRHIRGLFLAASRTGRLAEALSELVEHQRAARSLRWNILGAVAYPLVVLGLAAIVLGAIVFLLGRTYGQLFDDFKLKLPVATMMLLALREGWAWLVLGMLAIALPIVVLVWLRGGQAGWYRLIGTMPVFGALWQWCGFAEWAGLLSVLVRNQIPLPEALQLAGDGVGNRAIGQLSQRLAVGTQRGESVSSLLAATREAPASLIPLVRWGERHGAVADALGTIREMMEARVRGRALLLRSVLPTILFLAIGCAVVFLVVALFLPLVSLVQGLSS